MVISCSNTGVNGEARYVWNVVSVPTGPGPEVGAREVTAHEIAADSVLPEGKQGCSLLAGSQPLQSNKFEYFSYSMLCVLFFSLRFRRRNLSIE